MLARLTAMALLSAPVVLPTAAPFQPAKAAAGVKEVIGHMGSCGDRPGNTLASIRRAIEAKAHVAEVDVRTTKEGVMVCLSLFNYLGALKSWHLRRLASIPRSRVVIDRRIPPRDRVPAGCNYYVIPHKMPAKRRIGPCDF